MSVLTRRRRDLPIEKKVNNKSAVEYFSNYSGGLEPKQSCC